MDVYQKALKMHERAKGKIEIALKVAVETSEDLSLAYTPGVAQPCREIAQDREKAYIYTGKGNSIAIISDGTAVLGLGDIGPEAAMPVMEGKAVLFKKFADVNAIPICLDTKDVQEIITIVKALSPTFGGINLEDISAPRCMEIERALVQELDIPVFHDDQHGTAIVVTAGLLNALQVVDKQISDITVVVSGTGAAGSAILHMLHTLGVKTMYGFNTEGIILKEDSEQYNFLGKELAVITNPKNERLTMAEALTKADVFIGVSAKDVVTKEMVSSMKEKAIVFALANPEPEIGYQEAIEAGAAVVATGRSDFPNQINNVLAFPGVFRGALDVKAKKITEEMKVAAAYALANLVSDEERSSTYIIPTALDTRVALVVAKAVALKAKETGNIRGEE